MQGSTTSYVPFGGRLAVGVGTLALFMGYSMLYVMAQLVYQITLGVHPVWLGVALFIPRFVDAFFDPVVGKISDNTRSRWGRRRPFIILGAVVMGVTYGAIWMVPTTWTEPAKLAYFVASSLVFFAGYSLFGVPYTSLTYEMTPDYHERTTIMAFCSFFQKIGELGYQFIFPLSQLAIFASAIEGIRMVNWVVGLVLMMGIGILPALFVRERFERVAEHQSPVRLWGSIRDAIRFRPFLILILLTVLNVLGGMFASSLDLYVLIYYVFHGAVGDGSLWKGFLSAGYAVIGFAAIPAVVWLSKGLGKRRALIAIYGLTFFGGLAKWYDFSPPRPWLVFFDPLLCGPIWVAVLVLINSMLGDVCDEDERYFGQRREGMYGAIFTWVQKLSVSLSFLGTGLTLHLSGFDQKLGGHQTTMALTTMRLLLVASTAVTAAIAMALLRHYSLTPDRAAETRVVLEARRTASPGQPARSLASP